MTKKKMIAYVLVGIFVLYSCGVAIAYWGSLEMEGKRMYEYFGYLQQINISQYLNADEIDFVQLHRDVHTDTVIPSSSPLFKPAYAYALIDKDKNVIFKSGSAVLYHDSDKQTTHYIRLEEYMTSAIKEELNDFKKNSVNELIYLKEMEVCFNSGEYLPVSMTFVDAKKNSKTFDVSDNAVTHIFKDDAHGFFVVNLYDLDEKSPSHKNYPRAWSEVEEEIEKVHYTQGTSSWGGGGFYSFLGGEMDVDRSFEGYNLIMCVRFDPLLQTLTSANFKSLLILTTILFAIAGAMLLFVAVRLFNKNQRLKENQRAFTSAVAHEMKTPLAVIQNQCECILDGIAPEKNEQYVRSVYDEAQKMNGMVQSFLTFNRLAGADSVEKQRLNLGELVIKEIGNYENFAAAKGRKIRTELAEDISVSGNEELLSMAVGNYISNSIRHSAEASEIEITLTAQGKSFSFEIFNKAEPIDVMKNVWSILSKGDSSRGGSDSSSGMGLPICKRIFELHGFEYGYKNENGGVRFFFKGKVI